MKYKKISFYVVVLFFSLLSINQITYASENNIQTPGQVMFEENEEAISPVDPTDPDTPILRFNQRIHRPLAR